MYELVGSDGFFTVKQDGDFAHIMVDGDLDYEQNKTFTFYVRIVKDTVISMHINWMVGRPCYLTISRNSSSCCDFYWDFLLLMDVNE